jgi:hypothetical protein
MGRVVFIAQGSGEVGGSWRDQFLWDKANGSWCVWFSVAVVC